MMIASWQLKTETVIWKITIAMNQLVTRLKEIQLKVGVFQWSPVTSTRFILESGTSQAWIGKT